MSAFLGNIHYWLFDKIQLHESLLQDILHLAESKNAPIQDLEKEINEKFGAPVKGPLETEVNNDNIHGWLQSKIQSVELRIAAATTTLIEKGYLKSEDISDIYYNNGEKSMKTNNWKKFAPSNFFTLIFDYMIEGMPCDRVNDIMEISEKEFSWRATRCLHKEHWEEVSGDVSNFYTFRDSWIKGFLDASKSNATYTRTHDGINQISIP